MYYANQPCFVKSYLKYVLKITCYLVKHHRVEVEHLTVNMIIMHLFINAKNNDLSSLGYTSMHMLVCFYIYSVSPTNPNIYIYSWGC